MTLVLKDRVRETTIVVGTGPATLLGVPINVAGQLFSVIGDGNTTYYCIADQVGTNWEVGIGTYTLSGTVLARTTVLSSSNGGALVVFTAGVKDVFATYPSEKSVNLDATGNVNIDGSIRLTGTTSINTTTPVGSNVPTRLDIPSYSLSSFNQIVAMGTLSTSADSSRILSLFDARTSTHQPTIAVFNPAETDAIGFSWDGSNTISYLKSLAGNIGIRIGSATIALFTALGASITGALDVTGTTTAEKLISSGGLILNNMTISASYTIPTGYSALSVGPITQLAGVVITVPVNSRWVVL